MALLRVLRGSERNWWVIDLTQVSARGPHRRKQRGRGPGGVSTSKREHCEPARAGCIMESPLHPHPKVSMGLVTLKLCRELNGDPPKG